MNVEHHSLNDVLNIGGNVSSTSLGNSGAVNTNVANISFSCVFQEQLKGISFGEDTDSGSRIILETTHILIHITKSI